MTPIDDAHPPFPDLRHDTVMTEDLTDHRVLLPHPIRVCRRNWINESAKKIFAPICVLTSCPVAANNFVSRFFAIFDFFERLILGSTPDARQPFEFSHQ